MIARFALFAIVSLAATAAIAGEGKTGLYVYGSAGVSMAKNNDSLAQAQADAALGAGSVVTDDSDRYAGKALIGYKFNKYFGIEGGYVDVAKVTIHATGTGGTFDSTSKLRGAQLAAVAWLPATDSLSLFVKVGGAAIRSTYKPSTGVDQKSTDLQTFFGLGLQYDFSTDFFGRAEYERYSKFGNASTGDISANVYSLGLGYKF